MLRRRLIPVLSFLAAVILLVMLVFTTPTEIGPFGVLLFFAMFYILMLGLSILLVNFFVHLVGKKMRRKDYLYGAIIAFAPIMAMLAKSLGTLSLVTIFLILAFIGLGCFLISRRA